MPCVLHLTGLFPILHMQYVIVMHRGLYRRDGYGCRDEDDK